MKYVLFIGLFLTIVTNGYALKCYVCAGSSKSDCALAKTTSMVTQECKPMNKNQTSNDELVAQCIQFYETEHYTPKMYLRSCVVIPKSGKDGCSFLSKYVKIENCVTCTTDLCNKGF
ncbi:hypothetical protein FQR65_LT14930 [Abscondita terminalis]|nr:hypothetical protein FQR65_LT14930 [Abscondita terminalis]